MREPSPKINDDTRTEACAFPQSAMILAAGSGKRLWPITSHTPKCMVEVGGKPAMEHAIERLREAGVSRIAINVCHLRDRVMDYFGDGRRWGVDLTYSIEDEPLGTAGGVAKARWFFNKQPFVVWYGDNIANCRLDRMWELHRRSDATLTMALFHRAEVSRSGVAVLDDASRIVRFVEKPKQEEAPSHWVNAGIYIVQPEVLNTIEATHAVDFGIDVFPFLLACGKAIYGYRMARGEDLTWIDTPADYAAATNSLMIETPGRHDGSEI
jgi:NDP-sugar pyrophosphorylase family protein